MKGCLIDFECFVLSPEKIIYRQLSYLSLDDDKGECIQIYTPGIYYNQLSDDEKKTVRYATQKVHVFADGLQARVKRRNLASSR